MGKKKRLANDKTQQESFVNMAIKESIICSTQKTQDKQNVRAKINRNIWRNEWEDKGLQNHSAKGKKGRDYISLFSTITKAYA